MIITNYKYSRYYVLGVICQDDGKYKTKQQQQTIRILGVYNTLGLGSTASRVRRGPSGIDWNPNPGEPESILSLRLSPSLSLSLSFSLSLPLSHSLVLPPSRHSLFDPSPVTVPPIAIPPAHRRPASILPLNCLPATGAA